MSARTLGSGDRRVLALHGWFGTGASWTTTLSWLDPLTYCCALPDYRGYGLRIDDRGDYTIDEIAADAVELADELGWDRFDVLGHSMGGKAAQRIAALAPERVRSIVAVTPVPPGPLPFDDDTRALFRGAATDMAKRAQIIDSSTGHRCSPAFVSNVVEQSRQSTVEAFGRYFESGCNDDITELVHGMTTPVKVLVGEHDAALPAEVMHQAFLPHYPNSDLQIVAAAGHYPIFETPVALATAIDAFLSDPTGEGR